MCSQPWDPQPDPIFTAYLTHTTHMATMLRNMVTLGAKSHQIVTQSEFLKNTNKNYIKCRLLPIMDPKGDQKCSTLSLRNASWAHPGQSFCSPVAIYRHLAPTDYQKAATMSLKVSKILSQKRQTQSISIKSTNPSNVH